MKSGEPKKTNIYSFQGELSFKGFVENGLDSSFMINFIVCFNSDFEEFKKRGFTFPPNLFYYHEVSIPEVIGVLINKYNFNKEGARKALEKMIKEFNLLKIIRDPIQDSNYENIVEQTNKQIVKKENNPKFKIGIQDIIIIGGFLKNKINIIHSNDIGFKKTCEELGLTVFKQPKRDLNREKEIKKWIKNKANLS